MIETKQKPCKGTGKAIGYGCGKPNYKRTYGLGHECKCYANWLFNTPEGKESKDKVLIKAKKDVEKEKKKERREFKEKHKSIQKLIQEARIPFHKFIRQRDVNLACISCGSTTSEIWDAGHFNKAELYSGLIFDEMNCHKQCRKCNTFLDGNEGNYRIGFEKRYGLSALKELDEKAIELRSYKYSREELIEIKEKYKQLIK